MTAFPAPGNPWADGSANHLQCLRQVAIYVKIIPMRDRFFSWLAAVTVPLFYLVFYTPFGMDTTDFGYFYAYAWRILQGEVPYRDFFYIKPALPLYWHAFWMYCTPAQWQILAGKAGFCLSILAAAWLGALYFQRLFRLAAIGLDVRLLATCGFVFGIHSFPHMPWHTADGVLFCAGSLYAAICGWPAASGIFAAMAMSCKQSFALVPFAILILFLIRRNKSGAVRFFCAFCLVLAGFFVFLKANGAWENFRVMTTGQLDINEALDAGIYIYLRQNWLLPLLALLPALGFHLRKTRLPVGLQPAWCYLVILAAWHIYTCCTQKTWIGFGSSWPTLFMLLAGAEILAPAFFLSSLIEKPDPVWPRLSVSVALAAPAVASWSAAISGGYKIPAFFATPLIFAFLSFHARFYGSVCRLAWATLLTGLVIFWAGYQYPYTFPIRPLSRSDLVFDAGEIYPQATGVKIDRDMYERLRELKYLRAKYGANYKTLPGFTFAYYLNNDQPRISSDWLIDWEINGKTDQLYKELLDRNVTVFMERDQLHASRADGYARAGYTVPQRVVARWHVIEETPHFVVFQKPDNAIE